VPGQPGGGGGLPETDAAGRLHPRANAQPDPLLPCIRARLEPKARLGWRSFRLEGEEHQRARVQLGGSLAATEQPSDVSRLEHLVPDLELVEHATQRVRLVGMRAHAQRPAQWQRPAVARGGERTDHALLAERRLCRVRREHAVDEESRAAAAEDGDDVCPGLGRQRVWGGRQLLASRLSVAPREVELARVGVPLVDEERQAVVVLIGIAPRGLTRHKCLHRGDLSALGAVPLDPRTEAHLVTL